MKILVTVKRVVDPNVKVRIKRDGSGVDTDNLKMTINPFDEIGVEEAVRLKEAGVADEVVVVSVGTAQSQDVLRTALAMGADRAVLIQSATPVEPLGVAKLIRELVREELPDLIIVGKQAIDDDCNQTGQMLAGLLGWPQATFASKLTLTGSTVNVVREIDKGLESVALQLPALVTTDLRLNEPRYTTMPGLMKAKRLPLAVRPAESFGVDISPRLSTMTFEEPPARAAGRRVADARELAQQLSAVLGAN